MRNEFVLRVEGVVAKRLTGNREREAGDRRHRGPRKVGDRALQRRRRRRSRSTKPQDADETLRLKYRYLDLRREQINHRLVLRSKLLKALSEVHHANGFVEVETPILIKSTPEGARDFIVPSRLQPGNIYALPQSPQQLKQLLMVAGFDRYYQIAHCMRDEDARADRGPEFTQLDIEMSFVSQEDVMSFVEQMVTEVTRAGRARSADSRACPSRASRIARRSTATARDKPDVRFGMELHDLGEIVQGSDFGVFNSVLAAGGRVVGLAAPGMGGATAVADQPT